MFLSRPVGSFIKFHLSSGAWCVITPAVLVVITIMVIIIVYLVWVPALILQSLVSSWFIHLYLYYPLTSIIKPKLTHAAFVSPVWLQAGSWIHNRRHWGATVGTRSPQPGLLGPVKCSGPPTAGREVFRFPGRRCRLECFPPVRLCGK